jgi:hypothetical protein
VITEEKLAATHALCSVTAAVPTRCRPAAAGIEFVIARNWLPSIQAVNASTVNVAAQMTAVTF